jgi:hypothetical protein
MILKRPRSNAKANVWDIEIRPDDAVRFLIAIERLRKIYLNLNSNAITNAEFE